MSLLRCVELCMGNNFESFIAVFKKEVKLEYFNFVTFVSSVNMEGED